MWRRMAGALMAAIISGGLSGCSVSETNVTPKSNEQVVGDPFAEGNVDDLKEYSVRAPIRVLSAGDLSLASSHKVAEKFGLLAGRTRSFAQSKSRFITMPWQQKQYQERELRYTMAIVDVAELQEANDACDTARAQD